MIHPILSTMPDAQRCFEEAEQHLQAIKDDDLANVAYMIFQLHLAQTILLVSIDRWRAEREGKRRG